MSEQPSIKIRDYQPDDASALARIYYNTIHKININDYTPEQVDVWAPKDSLELTSWKKKWSTLSPIIAESDGVIVGFAEFDGNGHIDCFYCHHEWIGKGVGKALMVEIIGRARKLGVAKIFAEVSITAKPFFEKSGFNIIKQQTISLKGVELKNYIMEKYV